MLNENNLNIWLASVQNISIYDFCPLIIHITLAILFETVAQRLKGGLNKILTTLYSVSKCTSWVLFFCTHLLLGHLTHFHSWFSKFLQLSSVLKLFLSWQKRLSQFSASFQRQFTGIPNEVVRVKRIKGILSHQSDSIGKEVYCKRALLSFKVRGQWRNITQRILKSVFPLFVIQNLWDWCWFLCFLPAWMGIKLFQEKGNLFIRKN